LSLQLSNFPFSPTILACLVWLARLVYNINKIAAGGGNGEARVKQTKTLFLLAALTALLMVVGRVAGGRVGMVIALVLAAVMNLSAWWFSDTIVLRMHKARLLNVQEAPRIHRMVADLSQRARMPAPKIYILEQSSPNAFATGRDPEHGAVALSTGILNLLDDRELEGVIAHELTHIRNRDTLVQSVAATLGGAIMMVAYQMRWFAFLGGGRDDDDGGIFGILAMAILAPLAATVIQMAISRSREYGADEGSASLTQNPEGLASALEKLGRESQRIPLRTRRQAAHLFIVSPLRKDFLTRMFSTHPPLEERIARLRAMRSM